LTVIALSIDFIPFSFLFLVICIGTTEFMVNLVKLLHILVTISIEELIKLLPGKYQEACYETKASVLLLKNVKKTGYRWQIFL